MRVKDNQKFKCSFFYNIIINDSYENTNYGMLSFIYLNNGTKILFEAVEMTVLENLTI